jgi:hypothetical protein
MDYDFSTPRAWFDKLTTNGFGDGLVKKKPAFLRVSSLLPIRSLI